MRSTSARCTASKPSSPVSPGRAGITARLWEPPAHQAGGLDTTPASATYGRNNLPIGLPLWADDYGQLDAGMIRHNYFTSGRRYAASVSYTF